MPYKIPGKPIPLQRARHNPNGGRPWDPQKDIKAYIGYLIARQAESKTFLQGPLELEIIFYFPHTKYTKGKIWHTDVPDTTNLIKIIEDVATGILYKDDRIICSIVAKKMYADIPRTEFTIRELKP